MKSKGLLIFYSFLSGLILAVISTFLGRGHFIHFVFVFGALMWIAGPLFIFSIIVLLIAKLANLPVLRWISTVCMGLVIIIFVQLFSLPGGAILYRRDVQGAQGFCEAFINSLEMSKEKKGRYPQDLSAVLNNTKLPRLLQRSNFYHSDGKSYSFEFNDPAALMTWYNFSSDDRKWKRWH